MPLQRASIGALVFFLLCPAASVLAAGKRPYTNGRLDSKPDGKLVN